MSLVIFQIALFLAYTIFVWATYGVQKSISESWYTLEKKGWLFTIAFSWGLGVSTIFHGGVWFFLSGAFLCFVGAATQFKADKNTRGVHNIGTVGSIVFALTALALHGIWWPFLPILASLSLIKQNNGVWWIEHVAFFSLMAGIAQLHHVN